MAKAAQNKSGVISKRADWKRDMAVGVGGLAGTGVGVVGGGVSGAIVGGATGVQAARPIAIPSAGIAPLVMGAGGGITGGLSGAGAGGITGGITGGLLAGKLYDLVTGTSAEPKLADVTQMVKATYPTLTPDQQEKTSNCLLVKMTSFAGVKLTPDQISECLPFTQWAPKAKDLVEGWKPSQPQATSEPVIETLSHKLVDKHYLGFPQSDWTPELDTAFRAFIDAGTGTKTMTSGADWNIAAPTLGFSPGLNGALAAVTSLMPKVQTIPFSTETPAAATGTEPAATTPAEAAKPEKLSEDDILPKILSVMTNERIADTLGLDLANEKRRAKFLVEAAGNTYNAAVVLYNRTTGLRETLAGVALQGPITKEWARRNKAALQAVVAGINAIVSGAFGQVGGMALMGAGRNKAVEKLREYIKSAAKQDQWVKLASQRKDRIRSEVAAEMTVEDRITARRIKARESV